jgi:hypothetical protein
MTMAYASISMWKTPGFKGDPKARAAAWKTMQDKYLPLNKSFGATQSFAVEVDEESGAIVSLWPDEATRKAAMEKIEVMRGDAKAEFETTMTNEFVGEVRASV